MGFFLLASVGGRPIAGDFKRIMSVVISEFSVLPSRFSLKQQFKKINMLKLWEIVIDQSLLTIFANPSQAIRLVSHVLLQLQTSFGTIGEA